MIVVDTNTVAYLYLNSENSAAAERLLMLDPDWIAPSLWKSELRNVLALYLRKKILTLDEILLIAHRAESLIQTNEHEISTVHVLQLVNASSCSAYDCEFVALAKLLNVSLITADKRIIKEFPDIATTIHDYVEQ